MSSAVVSSMPATGTMPCFFAAAKNAGQFCAGVVIGERHNLQACQNTHTDDVVRSAVVIGTRRKTRVYMQIVIITVIHNSLLIAVAIS